MINTSRKKRKPRGLFLNHDSHQQQPDNTHINNAEKHVSWGKSLSDDECNIRLKFGMEEREFSIKKPKNEVGDPKHAFSEDVYNLICTVYGRQAEPQIMDNVYLFICIDGTKPSMKLLRSYRDLKRENFIEIVIWPKWHEINRSDHNFVTVQWKRPSFCNCCNGFIWSMVNGHYTCTKCKSNIHFRCIESFNQSCTPLPAIAHNKDDEQVSSAESLLESPSLDNLQSAPVQNAGSEIAMYECEMGRITCLEKGIKNLRHNDNKWTGVYNMINERRSMRYKFDFNTAKNMLEIHLNKNGEKLCIPIREYQASGITEEQQRKIEGFVSAKELHALIKSILDGLTNIDFDESLRGNHSVKLSRQGEQNQNFNDLFDIDTEHLLGSGRFGKVFSGIHKESGRPVAIKRVQLKPNEQHAPNTLIDEAKILVSMDHPGILRCEGVFQQNDCIIFVTEQLDIDMLEYIVNSTNPEGRLSELQTKFLCFQILCALGFLHSRNIAHCDLKPENVLLRYHQENVIQVKLADFGFSREIRDNSIRHTLVGTLAYLPPEVYDKNLRISRGYNRSLDIWSFGVIMYVSLCGYFPYNDEIDLLEQISRRSIFFGRDIWETISPTAKNLISTQLMVPEAGRRLNSQNLVYHEWFTKDGRLRFLIQTLEQVIGTNWLTQALADSTDESE